MDTASGPWCMRTYLEIAAATGCRRGELLALRWSDVQSGRLMVERSLSQTKGRLAFKTTKTESPDWLLYRSRRQPRYIPIKRNRMRFASNSEQITGRIWTSCLRSRMAKP
jgi:integrase